MLSKIKLFLIIFIFCFPQISNAAVKKQQSFEDLYNLGKQQEKAEKYNDALKTFNQALELSKNNTDVKLEIARIHIWQQNYIKGEKELDEILKSNPNYLDAKILKARSLYYRGELLQSKKMLVEMKRKNPNNEEIKTLLEYVNKAIKDREKEKFKVSLGGSRSTFDRAEKSNWYTKNIQLNYLPTENLDLLFMTENNKRGSSTNEYYETGLTYTQKENFSVYGFGGATNNPTFLPSWKAKAGIKKIIYNNKNFVINDLWPYFDFQYDHYKNNIVKKYDLGASSRVIKYFILDYKRIIIYDNQHDFLYGWSTRLDLEIPFQSLRLYAGLSNSPETDTGITVKTDAVFYGLSFDITKFMSFYGGYSREDRRNSYINHTFSGAIMFKF
ncbi:MAG TPA: tetratricopeptide repeat protein [Rickettsiales bacterium]|nr:tetratricopeptide repeat protein [Rickettsiales bacterium]